MSDALTAAMERVLRDFGHDALSQPKMFASLLVRQMPAASPERGAVLAAIDHGAVDELRRNPDAIVRSLANDVAKRAGIPVDAAEAAINRWKTALKRVGPAIEHPAPDLKIELPPEPTPSSRYWQGFISTVLLALVGGIAGAMPGILVSVGGLKGHPQAQRVRTLIERREPLGTRMDYRELAVWSSVLGAAGGMLGATLGWMAGGFQRPTPMRAFAAAAGAIWAFDGAAFGVVLLGLPGLLVGTLLLAAIGTFIGAVLGRYAILLLVKPLAWFFLPHF